MAVVQALLSEDGIHLREDYCNDFFSIDFPFRTNLFSKLFSGHGIEENVKYLVTLHINANIDPAQMVNFKIILRKLSEIHELEKTVGSVPLMESILSSMSPSWKDGTATFGGFTEFIVETLADTLKTTASTQKSQSMAIWQNCYHRIVSNILLYVNSALLIGLFFGIAFILLNTLHTHRCQIYRWKMSVHKRWNLNLISCMQHL